MFANMPEWSSPLRPGPKWRNAVGDFWRRGVRYYVEELDYGIVVSKWDSRGVDCVWSTVFRFERFDWSHPSGVDAMASRYISRAIARQEPGEQCLPATDKTLFTDRPALAEFMTLIVDDEGNGREPSVLMVCITPTAIRVGLKDDAAGGWLWREEDSFTKALNAIEKALASGNVTWSIPGGKNGKKR